MILLWFVLALQFVSATPKVIYGVDNRHDVFTSTNPKLIDLASSTAALIYNKDIISQGDSLLLSGPSLKEAYGLCADQWFIEQPTSAHCSGTLVAPDIIMTAGHCYVDSTCSDSSWVFDYKVSSENQRNVSVPNSSVYKCQEVLISEYEYKDGMTMVDHALIRLDRPVTGRSPVKISPLSVQVGEELVLIGHPWGLPSKITGGGFVREMKKTVYLTNLDAFSSNSGSGVFSPTSGGLVGILSSGKDDSVLRGSCRVVNVLKMSDGQEQVMELESIREFLQGL